MSPEEGFGAFPDLGESSDVIEDTPVEEEELSVEGEDGGEDFDALEDDAIEEVSSASSRKEKGDRAQRRIHQLVTRAKSATQLAESERQQRVAMEQRLNELQQAHQTRVTQTWEQREKQIELAIKAAKEEADTGALADAFTAKMALLEERMVTPLAAASASGTAPHRTAHDDLWLKENPDWDKDPKRAKAVREAWKEVTETGLRPGTAEFYDALEEAESRPVKRSSGRPPVSGGPGRTSPASNPLPREALTMIKNMGLDPKDPEARKVAAQIWSRK